MNKKQVTRLLLILLFSAFLSTGCAHKAVKLLPETSDDVPLTQTRETIPAKAEQTPSGPDVEKTFEDDLFEKEFEAQQVLVADPLSSWNKGMFHFNDKLYFWGLKPLARGYMAITPASFKAKDMKPRLNSPGLSSTPRSAFLVLEIRQIKTLILLFPQVKTSARHLASTASAMDSILCGRS